MDPDWERLTRRQLHKIMNYDAEPGSNRYNRARDEIKRRNVFWFLVLGAASVVVAAVGIALVRF